MERFNLQDRASRLIEDMLATLASQNNYGSMSCCIYDTAWLACISKSVNNTPTWLFPSSFQYILDSQENDGSWPLHEPGEKRGERDNKILCCLAALHSLILHQDDTSNYDDRGHPLNARIQKASDYLIEHLKFLRIEDCRSVGSEVLLPALLDTLESRGLTFDFPCRDSLYHLRNKKLGMIKPEMLYHKAPSALLHSLEAFYNNLDFDFDKVRHHMVNGSLMGSPSATAAYLMRAKSWDNEAEAYLQSVVRYGCGQGNGGVPSAFPSTYFEFIWAVSILLDSDVNLLQLEARERAQLLELLSDMAYSRSDANGLVGFAPGIEPDVDDSARLSVIMNTLRRRGFSQALVDEFETPSCFKTYKNERNSSISANCNALLALLLDQDSSEKHMSSIQKATNFVCDELWKTDFAPEDKWNLSSLYPLMLWSRCGYEFLRQTEAEFVSEPMAELVVHSVMPTLSQCLLHCLALQNKDGSWGSRAPVEETCYAILTLSYLLALPNPDYIRASVVRAIQKGYLFIALRENMQNDEYIWIEKVSYQSRCVREAYVVAALNAPMYRPVFGTRLSGSISTSHKELLSEAVDSNSDSDWEVPTNQAAYMHV